MNNGVRSAVALFLVISLSGVPHLIPWVQAGVSEKPGPILRHTPLNPLSPGQTLLVHAVVENEGDLAWVTFWYRVPGQSTYRKIPMTRLTGKSFEARLKIGRDFILGIEYYIEASDLLDNRGSDGNETNPYFVEVRELPEITPLTSTSKGERAQTKRPLWKNPWFWVGVLAIGGGVAASTGGGSSNQDTGTVVVQ